MNVKGVEAVVLLALVGGVLSGCGGRTPVSPTRLTDDPGDEKTPAFSPDGKSIAYEWVAADGESDIWVIELETRKKRRITSVPPRNGSPAWSPDGGRIAFQSARDGKSNIYVLDAQKGEGEGRQRARPLTRDSGINGAPSWSPDGHLIAFESDRSGRFDVWVMSADGADQHVLTRSTSHDNHPAWSPDGKFIAFSSERAGNRDIWMMNPDGSQPRRVTTDHAQEWRPKWAPDSRQLVYLRAETPETVEFWQVFRTGKGARQIAASSAAIRDPVVSPNGKWLAFSSNHEGTYDLYLLKLDNVGAQHAVPLPSSEGEGR